MKSENVVARRHPAHLRSEKGVALVTTLLLLALLSAVSVAMVVAASSDELISGYNRNMRSSFYAADSGLNIVRQAMLNQISGLVPTSTTNRSVQPLSSSVPGTVLASVNSTYNSDQSINTGSAAGSWPGKYHISSPSLSGTCSVTGSPVNNCAAPCGLSGGVAVACTSTQANAITGYTYTYNYSLASVGQSHASEMTTLTDTGSLIVNVTFGPPTGTRMSFAGYGFFVDNYSICDGSSLVPGTITGPVFSNGAWNFGTSGSYIFTDPVGAVNSKFGYQFSGSCKQATTGSSTSGGVTIAPTFQSGFQLGQNAVSLPQDSFSQERAVLDGIGVCHNDPCSSSDPFDNPNTAALGAVLKNRSGSAFTGSSGVYLPYTSTTSATCPVAPCMTGGGLYVEGNAAVTLTASTSAGGHPLQVFTVVQGGTTTTVTVDLNASTTTIAQSGIAGSSTINGVPAQYDSGGAFQREAALVYVDGSITSLKGPGSSNPAIQDGSAVTVYADGNIAITDDILYKTQPVTMSQNQIAGTPPATLIPGHDNGQVLGIFTNNGDIQLNNCSGCGNLEIDASIATIANGGSGGLVNTGSAINTLTILGGRIQNSIKNINSTTRNVIFDRRFGSNGFAPPWFPSTTVTAVGSSSTTVTPSFQRVQWLNQTPF